MAGLGVAGDAHCGSTVRHRSRVAVDPTQPNLRQVHLIHAELHEDLRRQGFRAGPGDLGENVTTTGVALLDLPTGTLLRLGDDALVAVTGLRNPCAQIERFEPGVLAAVRRRGDDGARRAPERCDGRGAARADGCAPATRCGCGSRRSPTTRSNPSDPTHQRWAVPRAGRTEGPNHGSGRPRKPGTGRRGRVGQRARSATASRTTDRAPSAGWMGRNHSTAPEVPMASTTSLLQAGQPAANTDRTPPLPVRPPTRQTLGHGRA